MTRSRMLRTRLGPQWQPTVGTVSRGQGVGSGAVESVGPRFGQDFSGTRTHPLTVRGDFLPRAAASPEDRATGLAEAGPSASPGSGGTAPVWPARDLVSYSGGQAGTLVVVQGGKEIFRGSAVSGQPGFAEHVRNAGPIPTGRYALTPGRRNPPVNTLEGGTCGADAIASGYQEINSSDKSPCAHHSHYCTESCPSSGEPLRTCFTPRGCWGKKRMKIEGSADVRTPTGGVVTRGGFYIHGGDHGVTVTSGCVKVGDDAAFDAMRRLKGRVRLCVGAPSSACVVRP